MYPRGVILKYSTIIKRKRLKNVKLTFTSEENGTSRKRKTHFDEQNNTDDTTFSGRDNLRINVHYVIINSLIMELKK